MTVVKIDPQYEGKMFGVRELWYGDDVRYQVFCQADGTTLANRKKSYAAHQYAQDMNRRGYL